MVLKSKKATAKKSTKEAPAKAVKKEVKKAALKLNPIEAELQKALKEKAQGAKESRQEYLTRLAKALDGVDETEFAKLSTEVQTWFEEVVKSSDKGAKELPDFGEPESESESGGKEEVPKKFGKKGEEAEEKPAKKAAGNGAAKGKKDWEGTKDKLGYRSLSEAMTHIACTAKNFDLSFDALKEKIAERGFGGGNDSYIYGRFIYIKNTIAMLKELGKL